MELDELLKAALEAVNKAGVPDELREAAFSKAIDILSRTNTPPTRGADTDPVAAVSTQAGGVGASTAGSPGLGKIAQFFGISPDLIEDLFTEQDGQLRLTLDTDQLGKSTTERAKAVALIYSTARQIGAYDSDTTHINEIRQECDRLGVYDSANFSTHMNALSKWFVVNGEKGTRTFRLKPSGRTQAKEVVKKLISE